MMQQGHDRRDRPHEREGAPADALDPRGRRSYPGVISSHSWGDPGSQKRIQKLGGLVGPDLERGHRVRRRVARGPGQPRPALLLRHAASARTSTGCTPSRCRARTPRRTRSRYPFRSFDGGSVIDQPALGHARVRHQHRRRRPLRALPRLDRGPAQGRAASRSWTTWPTAPRPTCRCGRAPKRPRTSEGHNGHGGIRAGVRGHAVELAALLSLLVAEPRGAAALRGHLEGRRRHRRGRRARRGGPGGGRPVPRLPARPAPSRPHLLRGERPPRLARRAGRGPLGADGHRHALGGVVHRHGRRRPGRVVLRARRRPSRWRSPRSATTARASSSPTCASTSTRTSAS